MVHKLKQMQCLLYSWIVLLLDRRLLLHLGTIVQKLDLVAGSCGGVERFLGPLGKGPAWKCVHLCVSERVCDVPVVTQRKRARRKGFTLLFTRALRVHVVSVSFL